MNSPQASNWYAESLLQALSHFNEDEEANTEEEAAEYLLTYFAANMDQVLNEERQTLQGFERRLLDRWRTPINLFKFHTLLHREAGRFFVIQYQYDHDTSDDNLFYVLRKLHSRSISIAEEVLRLIEAGYADGAFARWRSLHEIACTAQFIQQNGEETAQRFLDYRAIDDYHEMQALQKHHEILNMQPLEENKMEKVEERRNELIDKYGSGFDSTQGWADLDLDGFTSFRSIEEEAGLNYFRPIYKWASDQVHSDTKGATYSLSTTLSEDIDVTSGPSNTGFTDPAQYAIMSLKEVTDALLQLDFGTEQYLFSRVADTLEYEIPRVFHEVEQEIERQEAEANTRAIVEDVMNK